MELSEQIKKYRSEADLTQDELAEKIFVTRQTISNWENDKNYPDIKSLLLLSTVFQVSLDTLVKGDLQEMKEQIKQEDIRVWNRDSVIFTILLVLSVVAAAPLFSLGWIGIAVWAAIWGVGMCFGVRIEGQKKQYDIHTYREIVAFTEGKRLDEIEKAREDGKRPYQRVVIVLSFTAISVLVIALMSVLFLR